MADEQVKFSVCAVLPAAGSGVRTGLETPKQVSKNTVLVAICFTLKTSVSFFL